MTHIKRFFRKLAWELRNRGGEYDDFDNTLIFIIAIIVAAAAVLNWRSIICMR